MRIAPVNFKAYRPNFKANHSKENNVAILGSSKTTYPITPEIVKAAEITRHIISSNKNVLTGCGKKGIMGVAYYMASDLSTKDKEGKPEQNIVITKEPYWGDEDLENCKIIDSATSEANRIEKFMDNSDTFVIFPGGPGTLQEASTLISNNYYNSDNKKEVILVGSEYFQGLDEQYKKMEEAGIINCKRSELYTLTDDVKEVQKRIDG